MNGNEWWGGGRGSKGGNQKLFLANLANEHSECLEGPKIQTGSATSAATASQQLPVETVEWEIINVQPNPKKLERTVATA